MAFELKRNESEASGGKRYHFALSRRGVLGLGAGAVVCLAWVFILGVLIGRGYQPEKQVPELATLMPASKSATSEMSQDEPVEDGKVIPPEELDYYANLKEESRPRKATESVKAKQPAASAVAETAKKQAAPAPVEPVKQAKTKEKVLQTIVPASPEATTIMASTEKKQAKTGTTKQAAPVEPVQTVKVKPEKPKTAEVKVRPGLDAPVKTEKESKVADADTQVYDYVYQIASLRNPDAALRFRDKVSKLGLKAEVNVVRTDSNVWHRVVVHFRGVPEDTRFMKKKLERVGVDKPLMKSKKPI